MNLSRIFIERPVATTILVAAIVLFGAIAFRTLPVNDLPNVDFPTISVTAELPGANPEVMASTVATPLERQFSQIPGVDTMNSVNSTGRTRITLQFTLERNIDAAAQDVQTAISQAIRRLPDDMDPPTLRKVNPADAPIMFLAVTSQHAADDGARRVRRHAHRAAPLDGERRRAGPGVRLAEIRGARLSRSRSAVEARARARQGRERDPEREQQPAFGRAAGPGAQLHGQVRRQARARARTSTS